MSVVRYRITPRLNDAKREAPPIEIDVDPDASRSTHILSWSDFATELAGELCNDYDVPFPVGATLHVERIA